MKRFTGEAIEFVQFAMDNCTDDQGNMAAMTVIKRIDANTGNVESQFNVILTDRPIFLNNLFAEGFSVDLETAILNGPPILAPANASSVARRSDDHQLVKRVGPNQCNIDPGRGTIVATSNNAVIQKLTPLLTGTSGAITADVIKSAVSRFITQQMTLNLFKNGDLSTFVQTVTDRALKVGDQYYSVGMKLFEQAGISKWQDVVNLAKTPTMPGTNPLPGGALTDFQTMLQTALLDSAKNLPFVILELINSQTGKVVAQIMVWTADFTDKVPT